MARKYDEDRAEAVEMLREVIMILSNIADIEQRTERVTDRAMELFKKLDDTADGES